MNDIVRSVKAKQRKIKNLQTTQAQNEGSKAQVLKQLKDTYGIESLADGEDVLESFKQEKEKNEELLQELDAELAGIIQSATASKN
jgi:phage-related protein